jgi:hypothetical protein
MPSHSLLSELLAYKMLLNCLLNECAAMRAGWNFWEWQGHKVHYITAGTQVGTTATTAQPCHMSHVQ